MRPMYNGKIWVNRSACLWPGRMHSQGAFSGDKAWSMSQETRTQEHELELWPMSLTPSERWQSSGYLQSLWATFCCEIWKALGPRHSYVHGKRFLAPIECLTLEVFFCGRGLVSKRVHAVSPIPLLLHPIECMGKAKIKALVWNLDGGVSPSPKITL